MTDRTSSEKTFAQDALGLLFCVFGIFFAVSLVLFLAGWEPKGGTLGAITGLVVEFAGLLGPAAALLFSLGLAALGAALFLRPQLLPAGRPFAALVAASLGFALLLGAFGRGGALGAWLPGLVSGTGGRLVAAVLGIALAWLAWTLLFIARPPRRSHAEVLQRATLAPRTDAAGVSAAEAALLVTDTRTPAPRPAARPAPVPQPAQRAPLAHPSPEPAALRDQTIRPYVPPRAISAPAPRTARVEVSATPAPAPARPLPGPVQSEVTPLTSTTDTPPAPTWEVTPEAGTKPDESGEREESVVAATWPPAAGVADVEEEDDDGAADVDDDEQEEEEEAAATLGALAEEFEAEEILELADDTPEEEEEEEEEGDEEEAAEERAEEEAAQVRPPRATWEQIGLFDEEEEEAAAEEPAAPVELTPAFDFDSGQPRKTVHEPEPAIEHSKDVLTPTPAPPAPPATPAPPSGVEPVVATDAESGRWSQLVFDAGCAILEQKRVAVSMLERRFGVDFDQACRVLDELQEAGLIGPYMGGRARDILLTREEWLAHAPQAP